MRSWSVTERLLVAVLLPVTVLAIFASLLLSERHAAASQAKIIGVRIQRLNEVVKLHSLLNQEQVPAEAALRARQLGLALSNPGAAFGFSEEPLSAARSAVDGQLNALGAAVPGSFHAELTKLRAEFDAGRISATEIDHTFSALSQMLGLLFAERLSSLQRLTASNSRAAALSQSLAALRNSNEVLSADSGVVSDFSDYYFAAPAQRRDQLIALSAQLALLERATRDFAAETRGPANLAFGEVISEPAWKNFRATVASAVAGQLIPQYSGNAHPRPSELERLIPVAQLFAAGYSSGQKLYSVIALAEQEVLHNTAALQAKSASDFNTLLIETIFAIAITVALALLMARSISRPLHSLETQAAAVSSGQLDLEPLRPAGPKETIAVSETFNELVSNLRLLEAKSRALAACSFDDPVLAEPLPGDLGAALERSVSVVSGSLVELDSMQQRLVHQATHDTVTGLHNRAAAIEYLGQALARASRSSEALSVLFVDLEDFKRTNDTHGHAVGDAILKAIAQRMGEAARSGDFIARFGSDEFAVIAERISDGNEATAIATRLIEAASEPVEVAGRKIGLGAHVGVAFALDGAADDPSQLLARADLALVRAKNSIKSRIALYDESMQQALQARSAIEQDLHQALDRGGDGLFLQYQPLVDAASDELRCVEALVRWERRDHGLTQPNDFIPVAEASDLIIRLDRWVLGRALRQLQEWRNTGLAEVSVAVNISGRHLLSGSLVEHVTEALTATGVAPSRLIIELTETVLLADLPAVAVEAERLRSLGIRVSIDDFGTGYTSLAHLQHLIVDEIKIDRSFVQQLPDGRDSSLVRMVADLGHHLGVSIVGEGVETDEQLGALREIGCDTLQGYLIGRPLAVESLLAWQVEHSATEAPRQLGEAA